MLATEVERVLREGAAALPTLVVDAEAVRPLLAERLEGEDALHELDAAELYLACACALAEPAALAAFEARYFAVIPAALARLALGHGEISEVAQRLRVRLFVAETGCVPRIVSYAGRGQLGGLVRVAALRLGLNLLKDRNRLQGRIEDLEDVAMVADDPALAHLKAQHRAAFKGAFEEAIGDLPARQRSLLALAIVKGLGVDRIGAIYGVHRATAARWVVAARQELTRAVRRALHVRLRVPDHEIGDMVPLVESQLELSLERILSSRPV